MGGYMFDVEKKWKTRWPSFVGNQFNFCFIEIFTCDGFCRSMWHSQARTRIVWVFPHGWPLIAWTNTHYLLCIRKQAHFYKKGQQVSLVAPMVSALVANLKGCPTFQRTFDPMTNSQQPMKTMSNRLAYWS